MTASVDRSGVEDPWSGVSVDLVALQTTVCQVFHVPITQCGPPTAIGLEQEANYVRVYSFNLPTRTVVARLVAPVKPLFKTESEVAAMNFVRSRTSLPVPTVFAYCLDSINPVGVEWLIMEHMPGLEMGVAWNHLQLPQKRRLALDLIDLYDQLSRLKASGCGSIYQSVNAVDDHGLLGNSVPDISRKYSRSPRWAPLALESLPEYVKLIAFNGNPPTRSEYDLPTREKCVELFQSIYNLYPNSTAFGPSADSSTFCFLHGDLHEGNILIDPQTGAIAGIIDWEGAGFRPLWAEVCGVGWFEEDHQRFILGAGNPANFDDNNLEDAELRAFFRAEMYKRNPDLFACFLGGVELRAVIHAAVDDPRPEGGTDIFLNRYYRLGCWDENRRGPFPWDMEAWQHRRVHLDEIYMKQRAIAA